MNTEWKLVPVEPTDEMEVAAENDYEQTGATFPRWKSAYAAMMNAAPPAPTSMADEMTEGSHITKIDRTEFENITKPLIKWLNENGHPHTSIVVRTDGAEFLEGQIGYQNDEFIRG